MTQYLQRLAGREPCATGIGHLDYAQMARAADVKGIRADDPSRISAAWDDALAEDGPVLVEFLASHDFPRPRPALHPTRRLRTPGLCAPDHMLAAACVEPGATE
jgi:thiamine pyrophosphate-dependent acetolactate synthase large subunit-like protein